MGVSTLTKLDHTNGEGLTGSVRDERTTPPAASSASFDAVGVLVSLTTNLDSAVKVNIVGSAGDEAESSDLEVLGGVVRLELVDKGIVFLASVCGIEFINIKNRTLTSDERERNRGRE